jgi:hypothetical protein
MKTLLAGWFSFEEGGATAGDLMACELAREWLELAGYSYDIALAPPFYGGVNWRYAIPSNYSEIVFVCGPFGKGPQITEFLEHFGDCPMIGLNLTLPLSLDVWNPFEILFERDSSAVTNPDITFLNRQDLVPVVGVCLLEPYSSVDALDASANNSIQRLIDSQEISVVLIDTRLDANITGLRSAAEVESLIARMDLVVTTRLHGTVLSLKNGVPVIAIDPVAGGAKICQQGKTIGWPMVFAADTVTDEELKDAFGYCLTEEARKMAKECSERATKKVQELRSKFIDTLVRRREYNNRKLVGTNTTIDCSGRSTILTTNRNRLNVNTYPHTYKFVIKKPAENQTISLGKVRMIFGKTGLLALVGQCLNYLSRKVQK